MKIYQLRLAKGLSQEQLAAKARISRKYVSILEGKHPKSPTLVTIEKIAKAFKMEAWQLLM